MTACIFCRMEAGEEPASEIVCDRQARVILDLFPVTHGHALVIARQHSVQLAGLETGVAAHLLAQAQRLMAAQRAWDSRIVGHNLLINDGPAAGQHVPHVHLHVIPRRRGDNLAVLGNWLTRFARRLRLAARRQQLDQLASELRRYYDEVADRG